MILNHPEEHFWPDMISNSIENSLDADITVSIEVCLNGTSTTAVCVNGNKMFLSSLSKNVVFSIGGLKQMLLISCVKSGSGILLEVAIIVI